MYTPLLLFRPIPSLSTTSSAHRILLSSAETPRNLRVPAISILVLAAICEAWVVVLGPDWRCECGADIIAESGTRNGEAESDEGFVVGSDYGGNA